MYDSAEKCGSAEEEGDDVRQLFGMLLAALIAEPTMAQSSIGRKEVNDPSAYRPGLFFKTYEQALVPLDARADDVERFIFQMRNDAGLRPMAEVVRALPDDGLARMVVAAFESMLSNVLSIQFFQVLYAGDAQRQADAMRRAYNEIHGTDGTSFKVPLRTAPAFHRASMRTAGRELEARGGWRNVAGTYALIAQGECPISSGALTIVQNSFLFEGLRGSELLFFGAAGSAGAWIVANEQRYGAAERGADGNLTKVEVPDRPSELFRASILEAQIELTGTVFKKCSIVLRRDP